MKVCIVGAGNIGLAMASDISLSHKAEVVVYSHSEIDMANLVFEDKETGLIANGVPATSTCDLEYALDGADYVFCTYPAFLRRGFIDECSPFLKKGVRLGFVPGYGGAEYSCSALIAKGVQVFALQRVPFVARQKEKHVSMLLSKKTRLFVAALPKNALGDIARDVETLLGIPVSPLDNYLAVTLAPSNPLLHLTGLYGVFHDWEPGDTFDRQLMFYDEWNDDTSRVLFAYDAELQEICRKIPLDMHEVVPLPIYYESPTPEAMTKKLKSIEAFKVVEVPLRIEAGRYVPDFGSRMFTEDFPFGIAIIKYYALITETTTPTIDMILDFYNRKTGIKYFNDDGSLTSECENTGIPSIYGFKDIKSIVDFYEQGA